jgi:Eco29kI restriction endonuclease
METQEPFNPLSKKNLGYSVAEALLAKPAEPLPPAAAFEGAGIYAIYYLGDFSSYKPIAERNKNNKFGCPIYVGKAVPAGARKGGFGLDAPAGKVLFQRLNEHADSIKEADNLKIQDFRCRYLTVDDIWIPLGESLLIEMFSPLWNKVLDGFGNHDPGSGRYNQQISPWDILHPGRAWAKKLKPGRPIEKILEEVTNHLKAK